MAGAMGLCSFSVISFGMYNPLKSLIQGKLSKVLIYRIYSEQQKYYQPISDIVAIVLKREANFSA